MAVHRDQALAVIDQHGVAIEEVIAGIDDLAICRGVDRRPHRCGNVHPGVRSPRLVVEDATPAKGAGTHAIHGRQELQSGRWMLGKGRQRGMQPCGLARVALQVALG